MKKLISPPSSIILYLIFLLLTLIIAFNLARSDKDTRFVHYQEVSFSTAWHYDYLNGMTGTTKLPNDLPQTDSSILILSNKIPTLTQPTSFFFRARHTAVKIYVGDKLMIDTYSTTKPNHFGLEGIVYHELLLLPENSGEMITIESYSQVSRYLTKPGNIYLGDRGVSPKSSALLFLFK